MMAALVKSRCRTDSGYRAAALDWLLSVYWSPSSENGTNFGRLTSTDTFRSANLPKCLIQTGRSDMPLKEYEQTSHLPQTVSKHQD